MACLLPFLLRCFTTARKQMELMAVCIAINIVDVLWFMLMQTSLYFLFARICRRLRMRCSGNNPADVGNGIVEFCVASGQAGVALPTVVSGYAQPALM